MENFEYPNCPYCGQESRKDGKTRDGEQRYQCRSCLKQFKESTGSPEEFMDVSKMADEIISIILNSSSPQRDNWAKFIKSDADKMADKARIVDAVKAGNIKLKPGSLLIVEYKKYVRNLQCALRNIKKDPDKIENALSKIL